MSDVEQAQYTVLKKDDSNIEIRIYEPQIVAQATVNGTRDEAANKGFKVIADYIFGNNLSKKDVAMTAPVTQTSSEKIAMTAPVLQEPTAQDKWSIQFVMPAKYTMATLPKPVNPAVMLRSIPAKKFIVIRFSGRSTPDNLDFHTQKLQEYILYNKLEVISDKIFAFYNPPWTLPMFRRNEVMFEIAG